MISTHRDRCPCPAKTAFRTETAARRALERMRYTGAAMPIRAYQCPCGRWHLTSQPLTLGELPP